MHAPATQTVVSREVPNRLPDVDGYRIDGTLGRGGIAVVFEATQLSLRRKVALKVLADGVADDPERTARVQREAIVQARLDHPHVVEVYETGVAADGPFIAMRLIRGTTLRRRIATGDLRPAQVFRLLRPVADALDRAHAQGIVHRDVKPENILIGAGDHAYLADFGIAHGLGPSLTAAGQVLGTPGYIAPEVWAGGDSTAAADVYAFAAVLRACLPATPALDEVLHRSLAATPGDRHRTVGALVADAERACAATRRRGRLRDRRSRAVRCAAVGMLVTGGCAAAAALTPTPEPVSASLDEPMVTAMTRADFIRERRIAAPAGAAPADVRSGAAIEANVRVHGGARDLVVTCSVRDLTAEAFVGDAHAAQPAGRAASSTAPCWVPMSRVPGHRYRATLRLWADQERPVLLATRYRDFLAVRR